VVWAHCQSKEVLDDARCPTCGMSKAEWTVHLDATRVFKVSTGKSGKDKATSWLEVLVLDRDGVPLRGTSSSLFVDLPNGRRVQQGLQDGLCRLEGIAPGACRVSHPFLRPRDLRDGEPSPPGGPVRMVDDQTSTGDRGVTCATGTRLTLQLCHFIEIIAQDHEGVALPHEPFAVEFRDGTPRIEGRLDELGRTRIVGLLRGGPCDVVFPKRLAGALELTRTL